MTIKEAWDGYNKSVIRYRRFEEFYYCLGSSSNCAGCGQRIVSGLWDKRTNKDYCMNCAETTEVNDDKVESCS